MVSNISIKWSLFYSIIIVGLYAVKCTQYCYVSQIISYQAFACTQVNSYNNMTGKWIVCQWFYIFFKLEIICLHIVM